MKAQKNALEWTVFAISLVLILAVVIVLVRSGSSAGQAAPALRVTTGSASAAGGGGHQIPVRVRNDGQSVEEARIEVSLMQGDTVVERAELIIAFVPEESEREGWVVFQRNPQCCKVMARAVAFEKP